MKRQRLAWSLGIAGALASVLGAGVVVSLGAPASLLLGYLFGILMGLLGGLVAYREPRNSIGWLMCGTSLAASLVHLPVGYGYLALVIEHGALPFGSAAVWLGAWGWRNPAAVLDEFRADVESVVSVIDVNKVACRLLDQAVIAFDARAAALYLTSNPASDPVYSHGRMNGEDAVEVPLRHEGRNLGRLVLGGRRGQMEYSEADLRLLQRSADTVSEALVLAAHLGHRPPEEAR